ncbi:MAG: SseB family protein [Planctomycetes bacterium]|nr:SseB family protein [Planctomycetota bacterium]
MNDAGSRVLVIARGKTPEVLEAHAEDAALYEGFYPGAERRVVADGEELRSVIRAGRHDIVHLLGDFKEDGSLRVGPGTRIPLADLLALCEDAGVKLLWLANVQWFDRGDELPRDSAMHLIITHSRNEYFSSFLRSVLERMSQGVPLPKALTETAPEASGRPPKGFPGILATGSPRQQEVFLPGGEARGLVRKPIESGREIEEEEAEDALTQLDSAFDRARADPENPEQVQAYYTLLFNSLVYVPTAGPSNTGPAGEVGLRPLVLDPGGTPCVAMFDRLTRLAAWAKREVPFAAMKAGEVIMGLDPKLGIALNLGTDHFTEIQADELAARGS